MHELDYAEHNLTLPTSTLLKYKVLHEAINTVVMDAEFFKKRSKKEACECFNVINKLWISLVML
jgi:hypothetical protein